MPPLPTFLPSSSWALGSPQGLVLRSAPDSPPKRGVYCSQRCRGLFSRGFGWVGGRQHNSPNKSELRQIFILFISLTLPREAGLYRATCCLGGKRHFKVPEGHCHSLAMLVASPVRDGVVLGSGGREGGWEEWGWMEHGCRDTLPGDFRMVNCAVRSDPA